MGHVCTWLPADKRERCGDHADYIAVDVNGQVIGVNPPLFLCLEHVDDAQRSGLTIRWIEAVTADLAAPLSQPLSSYFDGFRDGLRRAAWMVDGELRIGLGGDRSVALAAVLAGVDADQAAAEAALARFHDDRHRAAL